MILLWRWSCGGIIGNKISRKVEGLDMGKKIICESCGTIFPFEKAKDFTVCPVCNASFDDREETDASVHDDTLKTKDEHSDWITWYYYGYKSDNGKTACLEDSPIDLTQHGDIFFRC